MIKIITYTLILFVIAFVIAIIFSSLYYLWEDISLRNLKARQLDYKMDIIYKGKVKDIRLNQDMWCTYKFFLEREFNLNENDMVEISFKIKEGLDRYKICKKFWGMNEHNKEKRDKFFKENFDYTCHIL